MCHIGLATHTEALFVIISAARTPSVSNPMNAARWISLAVAAAFCAFAVYLQPTPLVIVAIAYMVLPLAAIWYGDELGSFAGDWQLDASRPGLILRLLGWVVLALTPLAVYAFKLHLELGG
jgi:hypothetical protein